MEEKICLKGFKNLVTVDDFRNELTVVDFILRSAKGDFRSQMIKYKHKLQVELNRFFNFKEKSL